MLTKRLGIADLASARLNQRPAMVAIERSRARLSTGWMG